MTAGLTTFLEETQPEHTGGGQAPGLDGDWSLSRWERNDMCAD